MKKLLLSLLTLCLIINCSSETIDTLPEPDQQINTGTITFGFSTSGNSAKDGTTSAKIDDTPSAIILSIIDSSGAVIISNKSYTLTSFNGQFISENIELPIGDYNLTDFNVVNSNNEVIFSTPKQDSEFANLVSNPLPITFTVDPSNTPKNITPQVLRVEIEDTPQDFGYVTFNFDIIETQNLFIEVRDSANMLVAGELEINIPNLNFVTRLAFEAKVNKFRIPLTTTNDDITVNVFTPTLNKSYLLEGAIVVDNRVASRAFLLNLIETNPTTITPKISTGSFSFQTFINNADNPSISFLDIEFSSLNDIQTIDAINQAIIIGELNSKPKLMMLRDAGNRGVDIITYESSDNLTPLRYVLKVGTDYVAASSAGNLYKLDFSNIGTGTEIINFTRYDYVNFSDNFMDEVYSINDNLYAIQGKQLFKSTNAGASFELINNNLPFFSSGSRLGGQPRKMIANNGNIIYVNEIGVLYSSSDDGSTFTLAFQNLNGDGDYSLYTRGDYLIAAGFDRSTGGSLISSVLLGTPPTVNEFRNDLPFKGLVNVFSKNEYRAYLGTSIYKANDIVDPKEFDLSRLLDNSVNLIDVEEVSDVKTDKPVFGIGQRTIYFDLF